jgi:hypothetical protein
MAAISKSRTSIAHVLDVRAASPATIAAIIGPESRRPSNAGARALVLLRGAIAAGHVFAEQASLDKIDGYLGRHHVPFSENAGRVRAALVGAALTIHGGPSRVEDKLPRGLEHLFAVELAVAPDADGPQCAFVNVAKGTATLVQDVGDEVRVWRDVAVPASAGIARPNLGRSLRESLAATRALAEATLHAGRLDPQSPALVRLLRDGTHSFSPMAGSVLRVVLGLPPAEEGDLRGQQFAVGDRVAIEHFYDVTRRPTLNGIVVGVTMTDRGEQALVAVAAGDRVRIVCTDPRDPSVERGALGGPKKVTARIVDAAPTGSESAAEILEATRRFLGKRGAPPPAAVNVAARPARFGVQPAGVEQPYMLPPGFTPERPA